MRRFDVRSILGVGLWLLAGCGTALDLEAAGSGLNVVVVVNQNSSNSCELGNYYCERRQVPPENVLRIKWSGGNVSWSETDFQSALLNPLLAMIAARQLTNQIDYVVLSMDIPFQTINGPIVNSTTATLFYGFKSDSKAGANSYAASEGVFRKSIPATATGYSFLTTMITAGSLATAKQLVDQGASSDGTFPAQPVVLAKTSDPLRNVRYHNFDTAIFNTQLRGNYRMIRTNADSPFGQTNLLGYQTGLAGFSVSPAAFVPGAMADSMTSFGGVIFGPNDQTSLLAFIDAGAAGSYGTVTEPGPDAEKFPDPQVYFYQSRGFSLAECYYQGLSVPFQGLIVGEPLAAPFAIRGSGKWSGVASNAVLSGNPQISVQFPAADRDHPLQQIDLFVDGKYFRTLTNLAPRAGNLLRVTLNGHPLNYTVPANATPGSIAAGLVVQLNAASNSSVTKITATAHGDRIELHSNLTNPPAGPNALHFQTGGSGTTTALTPRTLLFTGSAAGSANGVSSFLSIRRNTFFNSRVPGVKACTVNGIMQAGTWLQFQFTKTNGTIITLSATNQSASATPFDLTSRLVDLIRSTPALQSSDGVMVEDLSAGLNGAAFFNLISRGEGAEPAAARFTLIASPSLVVSPPGESTLQQNLSDLEPRHHVYVTAGATNLTSTFRLDTTTLPDGFHELTAVAYEGSHVRTQTRIVLPVRIQNSSLSATLNLSDLTNSAPVQGTYHAQVTANSGSISAITLFSTGGALNTITNQASASFTIDGTSLGAGLHPFYAVVENSNGVKYRTATQWVRLYR